MVNFKTLPFFKILLPYVLGICFVIQFGVLPKLHLLFFVIFIFLIISFIIQAKVKKLGYFKIGFYIVCVNAFLFLLGSECLLNYKTLHNSNHYSKYISQSEQRMVGIIDDLPIQSEKYIKLSVQLNCMEDLYGWHYSTGQVIIYLKNNSSINLNIGQTILLNSTFSDVNTPKNPYEFNYKQFLEHKNIYHVIYAKPQELNIINKIDNTFSFLQFGASIKSKVVTILRNCGLSQPAFAICTALLVGYDDEIDDDVMRSFSHSGTLHILSVSGMHTGLLYALIIAVFLFFDKHDQYKKTKCLVVILSLLLFVFITGLSPSVLRASLMLSLVIIGKTFYKDGNSYNTLFVSAFILLFYDPYLIMDAGFLLSYFAVFGIMYLYPILSRLYLFETKIIQWLWNLILMSISATIFTLPISLYFFHQFPLWFAFSNLMIIPISIFLMGAALFLICFYKITFLKVFFAYLINISTGIMLWVAQLTDNPNYGYVDYISFFKSDIVFSALFLITLFLFIYSKNYKQLLLLGIVSVTWIVFSIGINYYQLQQKELIVFHVKNKSALAIRIGKYIYTDTKNLSYKEFQRFVKPYILNYSGSQIIPTNSNITQIDSVTIFHANHSFISTNQFSPTYIIVSDNTALKIDSNFKWKPVIIADCSNNYNFVKELKKRCVKEGLIFYSIKDKGSVTIKL